MRKIKLLLLALLFMAIPKSLWAYTAYQVVSFDNGVTYYKVLVPSGADPTLMFLGTTQSGPLVIPDKINDNAGLTFTVTKVGYQVGYNCNNVTSVTLPETVVEMENDCFIGATLTEMTIPKSLIKISEWTWSALKGVPKCKVAEGHTVFEADDKGVLYTKGREELRCVPSTIMDAVGGDTYTIDNKVKTICVNAFHNVANLKKIVLPKDLQKATERYPSIVSGTDLVEFQMPTGGNTKFKVEDGVLFNNETKTLVCYPREKVTTAYTVPDDIKRICSFAMMAVKNMTSLDLKNVETMEKSALYKPTKLETITIPKELKKGTITGNNVTSGLQDGAFEECLKLKEYKVEAGNPDFEAVDGVLFSKDHTKLCYYPPAKEGVSYTIPTTVTELGQKAFQGANKLTSMVVPVGVKTIGIEAFRNMLNLEKVEFAKPSQVTDFKQDVFRSCVKLKEVVLPASITELASAFYECKELEKITVPDGSKLKKIKASAFTTNKKLKNFNFEGSCELETIESNAFFNAESLETFKFPKSVKKIELNAFSGCKNMKSVEFDTDAEIAEIGEGAFADCGLVSVVIPKKVTKIAKEAFRRCKALTQIEISEATTNIDPLAFQYCENLYAINVAKENTKYSSVDGYLLSKDKEELILFPPGKANNKFTLLPPSIKKIGDYSFYNCEKLANIIIPNKVESIGKRAFGLCNNLNTITFLCDKMIDPSNINQNTNEMSFDDGHQTNGKNMFDNISVHVRKEYYDQYNAQDFYKKFKGGIVQKSFLEGTEEYIPVSEIAVDLLKTTTTDHTFVLPTSITHGGKTYSVNLIGDYAFQNVTDAVKEVVVKKDIEYIGAKAFKTNITANTSTIQNVFILDANPTKEMLSTTRFDLDDTGENYNEFATTTKIYVKKSALNAYQDKWNKQVYNAATRTYGLSQFNFTNQLEYKIPGVTINTKYGTFAREFDTDLGVYKAEKGNTDVAAFVGKTSAVTPGVGDYGTSAYHVRMTSVDENGGYNSSYSYVPANTGVLLKVLDKDATPADFYYAIGEHDATTYTVANNIMHGIVVNPANVPASVADPVYVMQNGIFKKATTSINPFSIHKAYAKIDGVPSGAKLMFVFSDDNISTGITAIDTKKADDNVYYNLNGQRVTNPQHGVFIHGGRKVIIK
ncbi:cell surface protein [Prevotella sp. oral taxon 820]|nr:leucine-rich repeat domain-containing protein [Prevotella sp. oral taxon 820]PTL27396.1 cell surface protein [Prevotella sp. oral taxon 820]